MARRLRSLGLLGPVVLMVGSLLVPAFAVAATQGTNCTSDPTRLLLWENRIGDTSDGDDNLWLCGDSSNLGNISHTPPGNCHSPFFGSTTWNDCVDSFTFWGPGGGTYACFYSDPNYLSFLDHRGTNESNVRYDLVGPTDILSSVRWDTTSPFC